jgi:hypothetical protein
MRARTVNEGKKKKYKKKSSKKRTLKAGEVGDPTMPILVPKNNEKIFKHMQKSIGLKPYTKGAELEESKKGFKPIRLSLDMIQDDIDNNLYKLNDRMNGMVSIDNASTIVEKILYIKKEMLNEGFDEEDIREYLLELVNLALKYNIEK